MKLVLTEEAEEHLEAAYNFLYTKNPFAAAELYNDLIDGIELLVEQPHLGRVEPLLENMPVSYRSLIIERVYKAIYHIDGETIVVAALFDCRQDPDNLSEKL